MFEPKTYVEQRLSILEAVMNQILDLQMRHTQSGSEAAEILEQLSSSWKFHGHISKKNEAQRVLGGPFAITDDTATREWINTVMRHNLGLLEVYGEGLYNPDDRLVGNDPAKYAGWLALLEGPTAVVRDTRPSEFFKDTMNAIGGLPVLKIVTKDDQGRNFIHLIIVFQGLTMQSISLDHLPAEWNWDGTADAWRVEAFTYLNNMSKRDFLLELARAIQISRGEMWGDELPVLFVPESDGAAVELAREVTSELGMSFKAVTAVMADVPEHPSFEDVAEQFGLPANDSVIDLDNHVATVDYADPVRGHYSVYVPSGTTVDVLGLTMKAEDIGAGHRDPTDTVSSITCGRVVRAVENGNMVMSDVCKATDGMLPGYLGLENADGTLNIEVDTNRGVLSVTSQDGSGILGCYVDVVVSNPNRQNQVAPQAAVPSSWELPKTGVVSHNESCNEFRLYLEVDETVELSTLVLPINGSADLLVELSPYAIQFATVEEPAGAIFSETGADVDQHQSALTNADRNVKVSVDMRVGLVRATSIESKVKGVYVHARFQNSSETKPLQAEETADTNSA